MTANQAYEIANKYTSGRMSIDKCMEYSGVYIFSDNSGRIVQPVYVEKVTGKVGIFNPLMYRLDPADIQSGKEVDFE